MRLKVAWQSHGTVVTVISIGILFLLVGWRGAAPSSAQPSPPQFAGTVTIAGWPADPGTNVVIRIFRAVPGGLPQTAQCGEGHAQLRNTNTTGTHQVTGYQIPLDGRNPDCLNPANTYHFYVNEVFAGYASYPGNSMPGFQNLAVGMAALQTGRVGSNLQLFWVSGQVIDRFNRPVAPGTPVTAQAVDGSCGGTGTTGNLSWVPKLANTEQVGALGYYVIGIAITPNCVDHQFNLRIYAAGNAASSSTINVFTPPYGSVFLADLRIP